MANPLKKPDLAGAQAGLYECRTLRQDIEDAQACGINCDEHELRNEHLAKFFQDILNRYSSREPPSPAM